MLSVIYAECRKQAPILSAVMLNVIMLSVVARFLQSTLALIVPEKRIGVQNAMQIRTVKSHL